MTESGASPPRVRVAVRRDCALIAVTFGLIAGAGCERQPTAAFELDGATMGTTWSVQVIAPPAAVTAPALRAHLEETLARLDASLSNYRPDSELARFNARTDGDWQPISAEFLEVIAASEVVSRASEGAFDITVAPLVALWGFGPDGRPQTVPSAEAISAARAHVGYARIEIRREPPALRKRDPAVTLDLSAVAIGYAVDVLAEGIERLGVTRYLLDIGGEMRARGRNARGEPWRVGIERPHARAPEVARVVPLRDRSLATSGDYRNYFEVDGVRYSHTIDPRTGRPVAHDLASVTVVTASTMLADAWATAFMVLGVERGLALAREHGLDAMFMRRTAADRYEILATPGLEPQLESP